MGTLLLQGTHKKHSSVGLCCVLCGCPGNMVHRNKKCMLKPTKPTQKCKNNHAEGVRRYVAKGPVDLAYLGVADGIVYDEAAGSRKDKR